MFFDFPEVPLVDEDPELVFAFIEVNTVFFLPGFVVLFSLVLRDCQHEEQTDKNEQQKR